MDIGKEYLIKVHETTSEEACLRVNIDGTVKRSGMTRSISTN